MALHVEALFVHDTNGRLVRPHQPGHEEQAPPRFFLGRTAHGNLWRFAAGLPDAQVIELARLAGAERSSRPLEDGPERLEPLRRCLEREADIETAYHGPAFRFPDLAARPDPEPDLVTVTPDRTELLEANFASFLPTFPLGAPYVAAIESGAAVAICHSATGTGPAVDAGVETAPGWRRRGLGSRVVAAWARAVAAEGRLPLYSTWWDNSASLGIARRLGLIRFGADLHFR
ncbi:MAG: GNAT family N-acetyltransferase [Myxococcales bacterium]|nr:GNAT family N-acetyltransferase [Myxococcales bacterium]